MKLLGVKDIFTKNKIEYRTYRSENGEVKKGFELFEKYKHVEGQHFM